MASCCSASVLYLHLTNSTHALAVLRCAVCVCAVCVRCGPVLVLSVLNSTLSPTLSLTLSLCRSCCNFGGGAVGFAGARCRVRQTCREKRKGG